MPRGDAVGPERADQPPVARALVGRARELGAVGAVLDRVASAGAEILLIEGEPGVGKTALLEAVAEEARRRGFRVLSARADELGGRRAFGLVIDCLGDLWPPGGPVDARGALAAGGTLDTAGDLDFQVSEAAIATVDHLCAAAPCVMLLEDVHWADASSLYVLRRLVRHVAPLPFALFATFRPVPRPAALAEWLGDVGEGRRLVLGPLDAQAVERLVTDALGGAPGPRLRAQVSLAGGNPFLVLETLEALRAEGALQTTGGRAGSMSTTEVDRRTPPPSLKRTVLRRVGSLGPDLLRLLALAAVLGVRFRPAHLALLTRRPMADLVTPLGEAVASGLLGEDGEDLVFRHGLVREALYGSLPGPVRSGLHWDAAQVLAHGGAPPPLVAEHLLRGADQGGERAAEALHDLARRLIETSPSVAVELLERALALTRPGRQTAAMLADMAMALLWCGRSSEGEAACRRSLAATADPARRMMLRHGLAASLLHRGRAEEALAVATEALKEAIPDPLVRARLQGIAANAQLFVGQVDDTQAKAQDLERLARHLGDAALETRGLAVQALAAHQRGRIAEATSAGERAVALAERDGSRDANDAHPHLALAMCLIDTDRFGEAATVLTRGRSMQERLGVRGVLPMHDVALGYAHFWSGNWDVAAVEIETGIALAEETGAGWRVAARGLRSVIALGRGDRLTAERWLAAGEAERAAGEAGYRTEWWHWARLLHAWHSGNAAPALDWVASPGGRGQGRRDPLALAAVGPTVAAVALASGQVAIARGILQELEALLAANARARGLGAAVLATRGLIAGDPDALDAASRAYREAGRPLERAFLCEEAAWRMAERGEHGRARAHLLAALEAYAALEATAFASRAKGRLAPFRLKVDDPATLAPRPSHGWGALTAAERRVLRLLAERRSNAEIAHALSISRRTVETHVSNILGKVNLRSRVDLALEAAAHFGWRLRLEEDHEGSGPDGGGARDVANGSAD